MKTGTEARLGASAWGEVNVAPAKEPEKKAEPEEKKATKKEKKHE